MNQTNVIIRNVTFEDTFDCFPAWDPYSDGSQGNWNSQYEEHRSATATTSGSITTSSRT